MRSLGIGGYTLLEVMLFLAISSVILATSIVVVQGQTAETEFRTSVDDVNTKFQQWIDQVQNGVSGSNASVSNATFKCASTTISGAPSPQLTSSATGTERGSNSDCIFLGRTILLNSQDNSTKIYSAPVVGLRTDNADLSPSTSISDAHPIAALNDGVYSQVDLSETYTIPNGTKVMWAGCASGASCSYMGGFFTSLNPSNGSNSLLAVQYPFYEQNDSLSSPDVPNCISLHNISSLANCGSPSPNPNNLWPMTSPWKVCLVSTRNDDWAVISVNSDNGFGATTNIQRGKGGTKCS